MIEMPLTFDSNEREFGSSTDSIFCFVVVVVTVQSRRKWTIVLWWVCLVFSCPNVLVWLAIDSSVEKRNEPELLQLFP